MSRKNCAEVRCGYLNCHSNKCDCFEIVTKRTYQRKDHIARVFMRLVLSLFLFPCCCRELFIWNASHACLCGLFWEGFSTIKTQNALVRGRSHRTGRKAEVIVALSYSFALSFSRSLALSRFFLRFANAAVVVAVRVDTVCRIHLRRCVGAKFCPWYEPRTFWRHDNHSIGLSV